jgi:TetR/AcrR family transcriptional regulator, transcriptional repressor of bet genes
MPIYPVYHERIVRTSNKSFTVMSKPSFIEEARRAQIVTATIETLADIGYGKASLAQIAKRVGISPSLIAYHFADKNALIEYTLNHIATEWDNYVDQQVATGGTATDQLRLYIESSLNYMGGRPTHFAALIEIVFNARSENGVLLYRTEHEDAGLALLERVLERGQAGGEFRLFNIRHLAIAIRGTINEFFGEMHKSDLQLNHYIEDVVALFLQAATKT